MVAKEKDRLKMERGTLKTKKKQVIRIDP